MDKKPAVKQKKSVFRRIVNIFLYTFIGIIILLALLLGFTQTSTFRDILRKQVVATVNTEINGRLNIGQIDGTIFTSLIIRDASLTMGEDTVFTAGRILLKTSPLQLLLKRIYVRNFELSDARINLLKDSSGVYNISKLVKSKKPPDSTKSSFPFTVYVADFRLNNISLRHADQWEKNHDTSYPALNMSNLRVDSLYLALDAFANIDSNDYQLRLSGARAKMNLQNFRLKDLRGNFFVTNKNVKVDYLNIRTNTTDLDLYAHLDKVNLFGDFDLEKLKNSPVRVDLNARVFDFADLSHFAISTDFLKGTLKTKFLLSGTFGNMKLERLGLDYLQTHINLTGNIKNLHNPKELYFKAKIVDSYINEPDVAELMPANKLPVYKGLQVKNINIDYEGKPLTFKTTLKADLPEGSLAAEASFDFAPKEMKYDVKLQTSKLNVEPFANMKTYLNSTAAIKGQGTSPNKMTADVSLALGSSRVKQYQIDSLQLNAAANSGKIFMKLRTLAQNADLSMNGSLDLTDKENPVYAANGDVTGLNVKNFLSPGSKLETSLNFGFNLTGRSFDFRKMESQLDFVLTESKFMGKKIDPTNLRLVYTQPGPDERLITLGSDFADMNIRGNYSIDNAVTLLNYESTIITQSVLQKIYEFNPLALFNDSLKAKEFQAELKLYKTKIPPIINENMNMTYDLAIKDFKLISQFTGINKIDMDGSIGGQVFNDNAGFRATNLINMKRIRLESDSTLVYLSNLNLSMDVSRSNSAVDFSNIAANMKLTTDKIISSTDLMNILVDLNLKNNVLGFNFAAEVDTTIHDNLAGLHAELAGNADMTQNKVGFAINKFLVDFKDIHWKNDSALVGSYSRDAFEISKFSLVRNGSRINLGGRILGTGMLEDLKVQVLNLESGVLKELAGVSTDVNGILDLSATADGYMDKPVIKVMLDVDRIKAGNTKLGNLQCNLDYADKLLKADILFLDSTFNKVKPILTMAGNIPIDLGFIGVKERMLAGQPISATLKSTDFDLTTISDMVPPVAQLKGRLNADLNIGGTTDKLNYSGKLALNEASFIARQNGLPYAMDLQVSLADETVTIDNLSLKNAGGTNYTGTLTGGGKINFKGMALQDINVTLGGDLALLSQTTKGSSLPVTGNLVIQSDGNWNFTYDQGQSNFTGSTIIKKTNVTFIPEQTSYKGRRDDINYHFVVDSSNVDLKAKEVKQVAALSKKYSGGKSTTKISRNSTFDFNTRVKIEDADPATLTIVISPELNSTLTAILDGEILYNSNGVAQGEFNLRKGSNLSFFKTFEATGSIYFESDITNPRLDITATYRGTHQKSSSSAGTQSTGSGGSQTTEPVEVAITLKGSVKELGKNLAANGENIKIFRGEDNIQNEKASTDLSQADAMSFIITGKFTTELSARDKQNTADQLGGFDVKEYAFPAFNSLVSSLANSQLGDAVQDVEIQQQKNGQYSVGISGKFENLQYSIGGTTEALQDVSKANIRFEYPFNERFFMRFERKDPIQETNTINEKINELALRYKFIF